MIYVATNGNDDHRGDLAHPLATIKRAVETGEAKVRVLPGHYQTGPIKLHSDLDIQFRGAIVEGIANQFKIYAYNKTLGDCLFSAVAAENIKLHGQAELIMPKMSSQFRHVIQLNSCSNVAIGDLMIFAGGGDGVLLRGDRGGNVIIRRLNVVSAKRGGISILYADNSNIESCLMGAACYEGLIIEPEAGQVINNLTVKNVVIKSRAYYGLGKYDQSSIKMQFINLNVAGRFLCHGPFKGGPGGAIRLRRCRAGEFIIRKSSLAGRLSFMNCSGPVKLQPCTTAGSCDGGINFSRHQVADNLPCIEHVDREGHYAAGFYDIYGRFTRGGAPIWHEANLDNVVIRYPQKKL